MGVDNKTILSLLGTVDDGTKQAVEDKITDCLVPLEAKLNRPIVRPTVEYNLKGRRAGCAWGGTKLQLNNELLLNPETRHEMINVTVPHELCHNVQRQFWPNSKSHGYEWQRLMLFLGLQPDRCHTMPTKAVRKRKPQARYPYGCNCVGRVFQVSQTRHNRIQAGRSWYKCKDCNGRLYYNGEN